MAIAPTMRYGSAEWLTRFVLGFGGKIRVRNNELSGEVRGRVRLPRLCLAASVLRRHGLGPPQIDVEETHRRDLLGLSEVADDRRCDCPAGSQHGNPHAISSLARRASQSSTRSFARLRSRPVSSSMRLIR